MCINLCYVQKRSRKQYYLALHKGGGALPDHHIHLSPYDFIAMLKKKYILGYRSDIDTKTCLEDTKYKLTNKCT